MEKYELPLVFFTVLSQMSVGMALVLTWRTLRGEVEGQRFYWLATGLVLALASIAAILHLAHPDRAYNALINLRHAWLSREILGATLFGAAVGVTFLAKGHKAMALIASVFGVLLVAVQGMTYAAPAMVAIANGFTMLLFLLLYGSWVARRFRC
ncbi:hydrogenase [Salmonella enterica subsp. enterica]|nr:hydrogenase [Salmonella enterica subsp. enterica]